MVEPVVVAVDRKERPVACRPMESWAKILVVCERCTSPCIVVVDIACIMPEGRGKRLVPPCCILCLFAVVLHSGIVEDVLLGSVAHIEGSLSVHAGIPRRPFVRGGGTHGGGQCVVPLLKDIAGRTVAVGIV